MAKDNYDDIFEGQQEAVDERREQRQQERGALFGLADQMALELGSPESLTQYLDTQARFPTHSVNNALLIMAQMPAATQVRTFDAWKEQGAFVQKGEKSIQILEPGKPFEGDDGKMHTPYNIRRVFDISQTDAKPAPVAGRDGKELLRGLVYYAPVACVISDTVPEGKAAHYDGKQILVRRGGDAHGLFRAIATEMAAAKLGQGFGAQCAAYMLCRQHGVEPPMVGRPPEAFSSGDAQAIRGELDKIHKVAGDIGNRMQRNLAPPAKTDKAVVPE